MLLASLLFLQCLGLFPVEEARRQAAAIIGAETINLSKWRGQFEERLTRWR